MISVAPSPQFISHGLNMGKWDRLRPPLPLPRIKCARSTRTLTASRRATAHGHHNKSARVGRGHKVAGPSLLSCLVACVACQGLFSFRAPPGAHAKPRRSHPFPFKFRRTLWFPARAGMPRSNFRKPAHSGCCRTPRSQASLTLAASLGCETAKPPLPEAGEPSQLRGLLSGG